ncbi:MAG: amidase family protein [Pseudomonadota bacterium]
MADMRGDGMVDAARRWSAAAQGRAIGEGRLDPVALAEAYLDAAASHPDAARIYARLTPTRARAEAEAARARALAGNRLGPLDGVPVAWKDLVDTAGVATEAGCRMLAGRVPDADAPALRTATEGGSVCLGKTHLSELAFSGLGINPMAATPPNRQGAHLAPGGSSSGAAAALVADLAPLSIGSDTGGSVRIPAAWNDLVGLKTTAGLIPTEGCLPLAPSLDTLGPLARDVEDAALGLALLTGEMPVPLANVQARGMGLFVPETVALEDLEAPIDAGFEMAVTDLANAGVRLTRGPLPAFATVLQVAADLSPVVTYEGWMAWGAEIEAHPDVMWPPIERRFRQGLTVSDEKDAEARRRFAELREAVVTDIEEHGLIAMPAVAMAAPAVAPLLTDLETFAARNLKALRNTRLINLLGLCAITVPTNTPMCGMMIVGPPGAEAQILRAARAVERALVD